MKIMLVGTGHILQEKIALDVVKLSFVNQVKSSASVEEIGCGYC